MAEFCKQCAAELGFTTDFENMWKDKELEPEEGMGFLVLCEGCGPCSIIDNEGTCGGYCYKSEFGVHNATA